MSNVTHITSALALGLALFTFTPASSYADEELNTSIELGRASVLLDRASEGLSKLAESKKAKISSKWSGQAQDKASDICSFVQEKLKQAKLNDRDVPLCSVE